MTREGEGRLSLALALVAASCIYAFSRVFSGRAWLVPVLAAAWGAIALSRWLTHRGIPRPVVACVVALAGAWFVVLVVFPGTTFFGLPGPGSLRQAVAAIRTADTQIAAVTAPIAPDPGYLAMAMTAAWVAGALSGALIGSPDRRRSRERRTGLSSLSPSLLAPGAWIVLFTIAAGVGQGRGRLFDAALFFASLLLYLLAEGWSSIGRLPRLDGAVRLGVLSMAGALILPNLVPGYRAGPVFPWARLGPLTETTVSPLVQIKPFLLNQSSVTLFHVQADKAAYWRLTSLDHFDGKAWSSQGTYNPAAGTLSTPSPSVGTQPIRQHYAISSLGGIWVPAAFAPTRVSGIRASTDPSSQTLIVSALHPGVSYDIVSAAPVPTGDQLAAAGPAQAPGTEDLSLPSATVASIGPIARRVVGSATNAYEEAVALQDHLRSFAYDDQVPAGSSDNYLADFLTHTQRGFCEQFAGSMAVMLRTLGIPARVAVGFLPGRAGPSASGASYAVTGRQAHAWPEAYFAGIGWVAFEPTPRVDAPPPAYTISPLPATVPLTAPSPGPAGSVAAPPPPPPRPPPPPPPPPRPPAGRGAAEGAGAGPGVAVAPTPNPTPANQASSQPARGPRPARRPISAAQRASLDILVALAFVLAGLFTAREMRFRLPGWLARTPQEKAVAAYEELTLRSGDALVPRRRGETETEYARSLVQGLSLPAAEVVAVTGAYQKAAYSMQGPGDPELQAALKANRSLRTGLWKRADWRGKARMAFSPRPLYTRSRRSEGAPTNPSRSGRAAPAGRPRPPARSERIPPGPGGTRPRPGPGSW